MKSDSEKEFVEVDVRLTPTFCLGFLGAFSLLSSSPRHHKGHKIATPTTTDLLLDLVPVLGLSITDD